ncbi:MAG: hypothetical protein WCC06_08345 [Candidatus Aminicenantales bacterium]
MNSVDSPLTSESKEKPELIPKGYGLISLAEEEKSIAVRDDQHEFSWLLDAIKTCHKNQGRFHLIDSGKLAVFQLEWLAEAGADIFTSDEARPKSEEILLLSRAAKKGGRFLAFLHQGSLDAEAKMTLTYPDLREVGRSGVYLHLSNRANPPEYAKLHELAYECQKGSCWLVYYHHGPLDADLEELARSGAWIHLSDKSVQKEEDLAHLLNILKAVPDKKTNIVFHMEREVPVLWLQDIFRAGAVILFKTPPSHYKSPLRALEKEAERQKLDRRACYIYAKFLL